MITDADLVQYVGYWTKEMTEVIKQNNRLRPYLSRLRTRLIVTNKTDAHLAPDAPKDVAVYYYLPRVPDAHLETWKNAIIEVWMTAVLQGFDEHPVVGRRAILNTRYLSRTAPNHLTEFQRDQLYVQGYNVIRLLPGLGPVIWSDRIWRDGAPVNPVFGPPEEVYKHIATPLALME